jgi:hypothetical protein
MTSPVDVRFAQLTRTPQMKTSLQLATRRDTNATTSKWLCLLALALQQFSSDTAHGRRKPGDVRLNPFVPFSRIPVDSLRIPSVSLQPATKKSSRLPGVGLVRPPQLTASNQSAGSVDIESFITQITATTAVLF